MPVTGRPGATRMSLPIVASIAPVMTGASLSVAMWTAFVVRSTRLWTAPVGAYSSSKIGTRWILILTSAISRLRLGEKMKTCSG